MAQVAWKKKLLPTLRYGLVAGALGLYADLSQAQQEPADATPAPKEQEANPPPASDASGEGATGAAAEGASGAAPVTSEGDDKKTVQPSGDGQSAEAQAAPPSQPPQSQEPNGSGPLPTIPVASSEPQEKVPASNEPDGATRLEDVVVTATKRKAASREVPFSINAFKGEDLDRQGSRGLEQILQAAPGVTLNKNTSNDNNAVSIRGIATNAVNSIYTRPTGLFLDDAPLANPSVLSVLPDVDPFDLQTVEVLKGPQGTLFGGSALSGAIRYITTEPNLYVTQFKLGVSGGTISRSDEYAKSYEAMFNVPIGSMAIRGSGTYRDTPGWIDDTNSGEKDINSSKMTQARAAVLFKPLDNVSIEAHYFYRELHDKNGNYVNDVNEATIGDRRVASPTDSRVHLPGLRIGWDLGAAEVNAIGNELIMKGSAVHDLTSALALSSTPVEAYEPFTSRVHQPTYELRLVSKEPLWGVDYLFGLFYMVSNQYLTLHTVVAPINEAPLSPDDLALVTQAIQTVLNRPDLTLTTVSADDLTFARAEEKAAFVDLKRTFWDVLEVNVGARAYRDITHGLINAAYNGITTPSVPLPNVPVPGPSTVVSEEINGIQLVQVDKGINPKLAMTWKPTRDFSIYTSAMKGFRFGGLNAVDASEHYALNIPYTFHSDTLWNYELGVRTDWFHGRMTADVTGFYIDWKDPQILQLSQGVIGYVDNVGAARSQGVEGQVRSLLPWGFLATVNGAYIDARTTVPFQSADGEVGAGTRMPSTPFVSAAAMLNNRQVLFHWQLLTSYSVTYRGQSHNTLQNDYPLPSFVMHNLSANLSRPDWKFRPELNFSVTNVFNKHVPLYGIPVAATNLVIGNTPRSMTLTLSLNY